MGFLRSPSNETSNLLLHPLDLDCSKMSLTEEVEVTVCSLKARLR